MQILIPSVFLLLILALLSLRLQSVLRNAFKRRPALLFFAPGILSVLFCAIAAELHGLTATLAVLILAYTFVPSIGAFLIRRRSVPGWPDFVLILLLWLPLEFPILGQYVPGPLRGTLRVAAYGVSVSLGIILFLLFRRLEGIKYRLPDRHQDFINPLIGFAAVAPVLVLLGRAIGFLGPMHPPVGWSRLRFAGQFLAILAATALPEEILFRGLIQNSLVQKLGAKNSTLLLASIIFGCAHLDNGPGPLPNWRYMILATIAGYAYGKVFEKSSSIFASAGLHALVDLIKHSFF